MATLTGHLGSSGHQSKQGQSSHIHAAKSRRKIYLGPTISFDLSWFCPLFNLYYYIIQLGYKLLRQRPENNGPFWVLWR